MPAKKEFTKAGFVKSYFLPIFLIFLIPGFGLWFFNHVEASFDREIRASIVTQIQADSTLSAEERRKATEFAQKISVSKIMASNRPEARKLQSNFHNVEFRYTTFRWMKRIALLCLVA